MRAPPPRAPRGLQFPPLHEAQGAKEGEVMASPLVPLVCESLLLTIAADSDLLVLIMRILPAADLARARAASATLQCAFDALLPEVQRARGQTANLVSLRHLAVIERATLCEMFDDAHVWDRWILGPSLNSDGPQIVSLVIEGSAAGPTAVPSSAIDASLSLEPGCRGVLICDSSRTESSRHKEAQADDEAAEAVDDAEEEAVAEETPIVILEKNSRARRALLWLRGGAFTLRVWEPGGGATHLIRESHFQLRWHPRWWVGPGPLGWDAEPPRRHLRLVGGYQMNFTGATHSFARPIRPRHIQFSLCLHQSSGGRRGYFNFFLSSAAREHKDVASFWAGSRAGPPDPPDVFTFLFDVSSRDTDPDSSHMLWLPSGVTASLAATTSTVEARTPSTPCTWHRVMLELDWSAMELVCLFDGVPLTSMAGSPVLSFGAWKPSAGAGAPPPGAADSDEMEEEEEEATDVVAAGFRRLHLFSWIEGSDTAAPDIGVADILIE